MLKTAVIHDDALIKQKTHLNISLTITMDIHTNEKEKERLYIQ
jgi:hypothetical protein